MRIRGIKVKNFKTLRDVSMDDIPGFAVLVGANGSGKSTFIGVFDFLKRCLKDNVKTALRQMGGFEQVASRGFENDPIWIELKIEMDIDALQKSRLVTYELEIVNENKRVEISKEYLRFRRDTRYGAPYHFIKFEFGEGEALSEDFDGAFDEATPINKLAREHQVLDSPDILALKGLGQFKRFDAASQLRELIENWNVSDLHIEDARREPDAAIAEHLSASGDNIALYAQYLFEEHKQNFDEVLRKMAERVPGVSGVSTEETGDGRIALRFNDNTFDRGFLARAVSDGTIRMFAYLALLNDPDPHPLLCVEEPENQLYPTLLSALAEEFSAYAERRRGDGQVFVTTHSPDFLNSVPLNSIYWLEKSDGFSVIKRAAEDDQLSALINEGDLPGWLWRQGLFGNANP